ncbi:MAG: zinc-dependent metalloprotease [Acidimicrobiales bacterium]
MPPSPQDPDNPLAGLLGDLMKVIGGAPGQTLPWLEAARALASGVAADDGGEVGNVDPIARIKLEELGRVVELHVEGATGLTNPARSYTFVPVSRADWASRALEGWRPLIQSMVEVIEGPQLGRDDQPQEGQDLQALLGKFASAMGPVMLGLQFGSAAGHLARQALGQYVLTVPWPQSHEVLVVPHNVATFASDWSLDLDASMLWVCAHELTVQLVLDRPHIAEAMRELLASVAVDTMAAQQGLVERLGDAGEGTDSLASMLSDPEAILSDLLSPGTRTTSDRLSAVVAALSAYVDHATGAIAEAVTGSPGPLSEAWYRYRASESKGRQAVATLLGFDVSATQVDRGAAFVKGVLDRAGEEGLGRILQNAHNLPTPAELDAPGLWLARIDLPEEPIEPTQGGRG